jgi:putative sterol carrier protein
LTSSTARVSDARMQRTLDNLARVLARRFRPEQAVGVDMRLRLATGEGDIDMRIESGRLSMGRDAAAADVTFIFEDLGTAWQILLGEANAIDAFMHGRFRSDGYLMMAFKLMEIFGSSSLPPTPDD